MIYFFVLGNTPDLAKAEIRSLLTSSELYSSNQLFIVETEDPLADDFFNQLGGTIKVGEKIDIDPVDYLKNLGKKSLDFGLSAYGFVLPYNVCKRIKEELARANIKSRFALPKAGENELSSVVVRKQRLEEFLIVRTSQGDIMARTIWVQDFEDWGKRDYGRPKVDPHLGMLPPKVARMMVNLAKAQTILDPFCGVGTILSEAAVLGKNILGADLNQRQIANTKENLAWLGKECPLFVCDARVIDQKIPPKSVDAIVTEPDLGPNTTVRPDYLAQISTKLEQLYLTCLINWRKILKTNGRVIIALPSFGPDQTLVKNVIDKAKVMGYSLHTEPIQYSRSQAKVIRNICVFEYGTH